MLPENNNLHPTGWHMGRITDHGFSEASTGADQLFVAFQTDHGLITAYMQLSDKVTKTGKTIIEYTVDKLRACGFKGSSFGELEDGTALRGNEALVEVIHDTYEGKTTAKVNWIRDPNSSGVTRSASAAKSATRFDAVLKAAGVATAANVSTTTTDDVPF